MNIRDLVYLQHILEQISLIEESTKDKTKKDFDANKDLKDATIRRIEIIGEAVKNISEQLKKIHREVEWKRIAGTRDIIIHAYFKVDWELVWKTIQDDIGELKKQISKIKEVLEKDI